MFSYIARQPILNRNKQTIGYELLFRDGPDNCFPNIGDEQATNRLLNDNFFSSAGEAQLTSGKRAFVNFPYSSIISGTPLLFPKQSFIIEILENCEPTDELFEAIKKLHQKGYTLALDDFIPNKQWTRFFPYIHIIKFDIRLISIEKAARFIQFYKEKTKLRFLAEKVETQEEYQQAYDAGFDLFQGFFFSKPEMIQRKSLKPSSLTTLRLFKEICVTDVDFDKIEEIIATDLTLSYKLLRHVNALTSTRSKPVTSFKQALIFLGEDQLRRFVTFVATSHAVENKPQSLYNLSLQRAHFCEQLYRTRVPKDNGNQAFLTGLFSLLDSLLDQPLEELIELLPLSEQVKLALTKRAGPLGAILNLTDAYDQANWPLVKKYSAALKINESSIADYYLESVKWSTEYEQSSAK
ncbi:MULTISPECIES: EAL and HDOD domain-containing protein [unclassified Photobacterium]|uniref:EAL and HDOD domain-containing protein n=1 Tax=unclassified Photobacterium TaxID=2628852 RepID=UPI000D17E599|nr:MULTISPECIES: HDOD domain-containing protein [unclassified Photobacterium]PSV28898.1 histidine kinase [Photobacterium sp. GB-56]PSV33252.1 histidine kinase [Photobacterium sp. GB-72]PSV39487.1 histidine kinase [Photobacterium sp. GB-27]PSV40789.1 histidine kinase [Photobacterium sp. GB-210]PSV46410.1 histidine kinase [Photobacterium sp. GB-36]